MKKWLLILLTLLLLTACGAEAPETAAAPYALEVEVGDSGVTAEPGAYVWHTADGTREEAAEPPMARLSEVPFVNRNGEKTMQLLFAREPDSLEISYWTSDDGYQTAHAVEKPKLKLEAPSDGASYLYAVTAAWDQGKKDPAWGSCTYYFRSLPKTASGDQASEANFYRLVQLEPSDLFGAEMHNFLDAEKKTCRSEHDLGLILDYLKAHLSTNFHVLELPEAEADYALRLAGTDGTQYAFQYGGEGKDAWIAMDGQVYEAGVMDLYSLWQDLEAESIPLNEDWKNAYLQVCDTLPSEAWGEQVTYGYLRELGKALLYDEILLEPEAVPEGEEAPEEPVLTMKRGKLGQTLAVSEDCQYWIRKDHTGPWCQVPQPQLWQWSEDVSYDMLFALYVQDGQVVAICEWEKPEA